MGRKGIPERWEDYSNAGSQIPGTRFIAFKVPLKPALLSNLPPSVDPFSPRDLMEQCPGLGLVIDLTNTTRYYDSIVFEEQSVEYQKIFTEGHAIPSRKVVGSFFGIVENFSEKNYGNDKLIGVHCTHGVNRTGYLICRYMIEQLGVPPDQAITDFKSARGHDIERVNYLDDLRKAPWLMRSPSNYSSPVSPLDTGRTPLYRSRSTIVYGNSNNDSQYSGEITPPYMPHRSRRGGWQRNEPVRRYNQDDNSNFRSEGRRSRSRSPYESRSVLPRRSSREYKPRIPTYDNTQQNARSSSLGNNRNDESESSTSFKSPKFGKAYYNQYYKGQVLPQYDMDFYNRKGGGGPHRPAPRNQPSAPHGENSRARQYRGRNNRTPQKPEESHSHYSKTPSRTIYSPGESDTPVNLKGRRSNTFSPGTPKDFVSPDNEYRRRSARFQPY